MTLEEILATEPREWWTPATGLSHIKKFFDDLRNYFLTEWPGASDSAIRIYMPELEMGTHITPFDIKMVNGHDWTIGETRLVNIKAEEMTLRLAYPYRLRFLHEIDPEHNPVAPEPPYWAEFRAANYAFLVEAERDYKANMASLTDGGVVIPPVPDEGGEVAPGEAHYANILGGEPMPKGWLPGMTEKSGPYQGWTWVYPPGGSPYPPPVVPTPPPPTPTPADDFDISCEFTGRVTGKATPVPFEDVTLFRLPATGKVEVGVKRADVPKPNFFIGTYTDIGFTLTVTRKSDGQKRTYNRAEGVPVEALLYFD